MKKTKTVKELVKRYRKDIDKRLLRALSQVSDGYGVKSEFILDGDMTKGIMRTATEYSMFADEPYAPKRVRPSLILLTVEALGVRITPVFKNIACCVEFFHIASLIHDDLPEIDNAKIRHGKCVLHKFLSKQHGVGSGVGAAVHLGYALPCDANMLLSDPFFTKGISPETCLKIINEINFALGSRGVMFGQVADLRPVNSNRTKEEVLNIHWHKTAIFIRACMRIGAILASATKQQITRLSKYGELLGIIYQIMDDLLDRSTTNETGKSVHIDMQETYPDLVGGIENAQKEVSQLLKQALKRLKSFGPSADNLRQLAISVAQRKQ